MMRIVATKTKSGREALALLIPAVALDASAERRGYQAADLATEHQCDFWRVVDTAGRVIQSGRAGVAHLTRDEAAAQSGPPGDRHDW